MNGRGRTARRFFDEALAAPFAERCDGLARGIKGEAAERRRAARLLAALIACGLGAALAIPAAGLVGASPLLVAVAAVSAGYALLLAALLAATGAFDAVAAAGAAGLALALAAGAVASGGPASPLFWLLPAVPLEGVLSRRRGLSPAFLGIAGFGAGLVLGAEALGVARPPLGPAGMAALSVPGLAYLSLLTLRLRRRLAAVAVPTALVAPAPIADPTVVEDLADLAVLRFVPDGALAGASARATAWLGEAAATDRLPFLLSRVHVADRVRYLAAVGEIRAGARRARCDVRLLDAASAAVADASVTFAAQRGASGELIAIFAALDDALPERRQTDDLRSALGEARAMSDAKSSFLAAASHELRTPLNAIIGFSDMLDQEVFGGFGNPRQKEYVGLIRRSGEHLLAVVNGLLDISKIEAGRYDLTMDVLDLDELIAGAAATLSGEAERKCLRLDIRNRCGTSRLVADRSAIRQILTNLLSNAVKFTEAGSVGVEASLDGAHLRLTVSDTGAGIAAHELGRLGQPFVQGAAGLARRYPGTGLGLSLVKALAELHHGSMRIESQVGRGTTVDVRIRLDCAKLVENENHPSRTIVTLKHGRETTPTRPETRRSA